MPFEVPEGWCWTTLADISNYGECINVPVDKIPDSSWILELEDIEKDSGRLIQRRIKSNKIINGVRHSFTKSNILYSKLRTYLNKVLIADQDGYCTTEIIPITCKKGIMPEYLCHVLRSSYYVGYTISLGYGVKMPRLGTTDALKSMIPVPPTSEQARIVSAIDKLSSTIDILEANQQDALDIADRTKAKILDLALTGKLVPQDPLDEPATRLLTRINPLHKSCDNRHYANVPETWEVVALKDVTEIITGSTPSKSVPAYYSGDVPFYKPNDLDQGRHVRTASEHLSQQGKEISRSIPSNSIAVCCIGSIGKCGYIEHEGVTNQQINTIIPNEAIFPLYLFYFCNSTSFIDKLKSQSSAVTIPIVNKSKLSTIQIPLPPISEQKRIVNAIETILHQLDIIVGEIL